MPFKPSGDTWLWLGLGAFLAISAKVISHGLHDTEHLTRSRTAYPPPPKFSRPLPARSSRGHSSRAAEDSIKTESLQTLATCDNVELSKAATRILVERFIHDSLARKQLGKDLTSGDEDVRDGARQAVRLIDRTLGSEGWRYNTTNDFDHDARVESMAALMRAGGGVGEARARPHEESPEETALRRRRREAMVLHEGDEPFGQEDIFQRQLTGISGEGIQGGADVEFVDGMFVV